MDNHCSNSIDKWIFIFVQIVTLESLLITPRSSQSFSTFIEIYSSSAYDHLTDLIGKENSSVTVCFDYNSILNIVQNSLRLDDVVRTRLTLSHFDSFLLKYSIIVDFLSNHFIELNQS